MNGHYESRRPGRDQGLTVFLLCNQHQDNDRWHSVSTSTSILREDTILERHSTPENYPPAFKFSIFRYQVTR